MADTFTRKKLAFIQLADTKGDIYDSGSAIGLVHNIIIHNTNTSSETVELFLHDGSNEYQLFDMSVVANDTKMMDFRGEGLIVDASSKITGNTTVASKVTCLICGQEET